MRKIVLKIGVGLLLAAAVLRAVAHADSPMVNADDQGYAIRGYDAVAYFDEGTPREGNAAYTHEWMGATWLFASPEHRDAFAANPEAYAPQFGGYCAYAVAKGHPAQADPRVWAIVDGKLYLNLGEAVQAKWEADRSALIASARNNWPDVLGGAGKGKAGSGTSNR